ncbi:MAG: nuclear transport factor 2 family protein [Gemmatimonadota bacterium]
MSPNRNGRRTSLALAALVAIVVACQGSPSAPAALTPAHRAALEDTLRTFVSTLLAAENALNAERASDLSDDQEPALTVLGHDEITMTRDSLRRILTGAYAAVDSNVQAFDGVRARVLTADVGTIVAHGRSRVRLKDGTVMRERSTGTFVVMRRPGGWKIVQSHITAEPDSAGPKK